MLADIGKYAHTLDFQRKVNESLRTLDAFFMATENPVISCGGGKDGTAIALLAKSLGADVTYVTADPPNPLPDREEHNKQLRKWIGGKWEIIPYPWNVEKVLSGEEKYPDRLKIKTLSEWQKSHDIDGVVFGIRSEENKTRLYNYAARGEIYRTFDGGLRCTPIVKWSAEDSLCLALYLDAPINPVYRKMDGVQNLELLHDGTWWAHDMGEHGGWIKRYYPDFYELYCQSISIESQKYLPCTY